ncbi:tetratricopeptide repeat protein [Flavobacterium rhizosphaerae]|uniref:Tetratricopeptide repeat protein n=1 Tax=Flavobacterium rhizosphaerae TaxID=3163298 RepID=A0ABW8Z176_9FLAO
MKKILTFSLLLCAVLAFSQETVKKKKDKNLPLGNKEFAATDYVAAEASYRISQSDDPANAASAYNLGNAIYRQKQPGEAVYAYAKAIETATTKAQKHKAYHNWGNALMEQKNYQGAVEAYKNALRNDPTDDETRYNYALAKEMLKNNPPPPQDKDKDKDKNKDKDKDDKSQQPKDKGDNKDKGDQGDNKDKGDKGDQKDKNKGDQKDKDQSNNEGDKKEKDKQQGQNQNGGEPESSGANPDKQRMENILDAMNNEEKKIQDKVNAKRVKGRPMKQEKDW